MCSRLIMNFLRETRGWLVQRLLGIGNAEVADLGVPNTAYYNEAKKLWVS